MIIARILLLIALASAAAAALAQAPAIEAPLPQLEIADRGEIILNNDEFSYRPWSTAQAPGKVHVVQYFGATQSDSELFEPFTDALQEFVTPGTFHVTTIINLDAAMWGTTGFVVSEVKKNKRTFPESTIVLDEEGVGVDTWELGKKGAGLLIVDSLGVVRHFTKQAMTDEEVERFVAMVEGYAVGGTVEGG
tara:strand:+ start:73107 stop:73682 length:576 start_codon:yes stop_codon:yes gene_type:complete